MDFGARAWLEHSRRHSRSWHARHAKTLDPVERAPQKCFSRSNRRVPNVALLIPKTGHVGSYIKFQRIMDENQQLCEFIFKRVQSFNTAKNIDMLVIQLHRFTLATPQNRALHVFRKI